MIFLNFIDLGFCWLKRVYNLCFVLYFLIFIEKMKNWFFEVVEFGKFWIFL